MPPHSQCRRLVLSPRASRARRNRRPQRPQRARGTRKAKIKGHERQKGQERQNGASWQVERRRAAADSCHCRSVAVRPSQGMRPRRDQDTPGASPRCARRWWRCCRGFGPPLRAGNTPSRILFFFRPDGKVAPDRFSVVCTHRIAAHSALTPLRRCPNWILALRARAAGHARRQWCAVAKRHMRALPRAPTASFRKNIAVA